MNRTEWLEWRRGGIGASDAPIIMGVSPWKTVHDLYIDKVFGSKEFTNKAIEKGVALEPVVRERLEALCGKKLEPRNVDNGDVWRASLDAISDDGAICYEIKCPGDKSHDVARKGLVPDCYYPQLQHQLLVTGLRFMTYVSFKDDELIQIVVNRDDAYIDKLKEKELAFWELVKNKTPPEPDKIVVVRDEEARWQELASLMKDVDSSIEVLEQERNEYRDEMIQISGEASSKGCGYAVSRYEDNGRVDYKTAYAVLKGLAKTAGIDPPSEDEYKSKPSIKYRLTTY